MILRKTLCTAAVLAMTGTFSTAFAADAPAAPAAPAAPHAAAPAPAAHTMKAAPMTKEHATEMATKAHPGKVTKVYEDTKKGKKTWEVKIDGEDGKKWEVHYDVATGALVSEEGK